MKTSDFYFDLPEELIAQEPLADRAASRLMVVHQNGRREHRHFRDIKEYLRAGDCLVLNDTKVLPARLYGERVGTGAAMEILLLVRRDLDTWEVLVRPGKKAKPGDRISFHDGRLVAEVLEVIEGGNRIVKFEYDGVFEEILDELGEMPLPPYITHKLEDKNRYQTVYARCEGSAAAPTAGLHFTPELLREIEEMGVKIAHVTLHVGLGTFRPVKVENVLDHEMHSEFYVVEPEQAAIINEAKQSGGRVIAVGTTSTRTLESVADENGRIQAGSGWTKIFIYPGYHFRAVDCLVTNFHLPESTLIMLVSALMGKELVMESYREAVEQGYRFFSFGDACLFLTEKVQENGSV